jgi:hypothetical protein
VRLAVLPAHRRLAAAALCLALLGTLQLAARATAANVGGPVPGVVTAAYNPGTATTPSTSAAYDGEALTVQVGYIGRGAAEPTIGVDKDGRAFMAAGAFDGLAVFLPRTFVMRSTDGGLTWEKASPEIPTTRQPAPPVTADPMVVMDETTGRIFNPELYGACNFMNYSDDGGETWVSNPLACGNLVVDHQTVTEGPFPPALKPLQTTYPNVIYYCANRVADANCGRSLDGGNVWSPTPTPAFTGYDPDAKAPGIELPGIGGVEGLCGGLHGHIDTDSKGRLFLPKGHCGFPWLAVSEDGGTTWTRTRVSDVPTSEVHLSVATDDADNVYMLWTGRDFLPYLAVSTDNGKSFGAPMMVAPPGVTETDFAVLEAGEPGKVAITFIGNTRGDRDDKHRPWNQYVTVSTDVLDAQPLFVSTTANDPADPIIRGECSRDSGGGRCGGIWDFLDIVVSPQDGAFWAAGADGCQKSSCVRSNGKDENALTGEGFAIRQLSGPRVRTVAPPAEG